MACREGIKMKLKKIEAGVYETLDGQYRIERAGSLGEWEDATTYVWTLSVWKFGQWDEIGEAQTRRELVNRVAQDA